VVEPPPELRAAFAHDPELRAFFDSLSFTHRREYVRWIEEAKREETRRARAAKALACSATASRRRARCGAYAAAVPRSPPG
jgi:uncharacterized protein YdeI (YjbR/CyaY-like superfamily)